MKKIFLMLSLLFCATISFAQIPTAGAKFTFASTMHDFGVVKQGPDIVYDFVFTNTGTEPLIIMDASGSCSCTIPTFDRAPVMPGKTGKIKVKFENNYELFDSLLPKTGKIVDVGCGYGFLSLMLSFKSNKRTILGIDYDDEKIEIAANCISKSDAVNFAVADVTQFNYEPADAFIISDVLHYLNETQQTELISKCAMQLNDNGIMIIRDADADKKQRHWGTRYTEFFSTNSGFNKTKQDGLHFTSSSLIKNALNQFPFIDYEVLDNTKLTSNIIFVARKRMNHGKQ